MAQMKLIFKNLENLYDFPWVIKSSYLPLYHTINVYSIFIH